MNKIQEFAAKINPKIGKLNSMAGIKALMAGMMATFPAMMAGSIATILNSSITWKPYQSFLEMTHLKAAFDLVTLCTTNLMALYMVFGIAYAYAKNKEEDGLLSGIIALVSFLILTPFNSVADEYGRIAYSLPTTWLGGSGMIAAMFVGFLSAIIFVFIKKKKWTIKLPDSVPPVISSSFEAIIPGVVGIFFFAIIAEIFTLTPFGSFHQAMTTLIQTPLQGFGTNIITILFIVILTQSLWLLGIHGPMLIIPVVGSVWTISDITNLTAAQAGQPLTEMFGMSSYMVYTFAGGGVGLALAMLFAKSQRYKSLGKLSIIPSIFGITEPLIFGTPIVLNFKLAIPHIFVPTLSLLAGYVLTVIGVLPPLMGVSLPTGTPIILMGLMQGGWKVALFQALLIVFWFFAYLPFFKSLDNDSYQSEQEEQKELVKED
ncbi:MAG: PTS sugar transporter subunit IIC [Lactovum sp.]